MQCNVDDMGTQYDTMLDNLTQSVTLQHAVIKTSIFQFFVTRLTLICARHSNKCQTDLIGVVQHFKMCRLQ